MSHVCHGLKSKTWACIGGNRTFSLLVQDMLNHHSVRRLPVQTEAPSYMCTLPIYILIAKTETGAVQGKEKGAPHMVCALLHSFPFSSQWLPYVATAVLGIPPNLACTHKDFLKWESSALQVHFYFLNINTDVQDHV